jgi:thiol-disulfide isomerase/thioredoxin
MPLLEKIKSSTEKTRIMLFGKGLFYECCNEVKIHCKYLKGTLVSVFLFLAINLSAQTIAGNLSSLSNQSIKLEGFNGLKSYLISSTAIDEKGNFKLSYSKSDYGIGYLMSPESKPLFVILSGEDIELTGESLSYTEAIKITKGKENQVFERYAREHPRREQALSAWVYLERIYTLDSLFTIHQTPNNAIQQEKKRIRAEDAAFLANIPKDSYVGWFLPTRKLISSVSTVAQYRSEEIPVTIAAFRAMDYSDARLYKSGLFKDAIESHFWLLENSGKSVDSVFIEMRLSIDAMMVQLVKDDKKLNEITNYLFDLLERHSLFQASEYLALKVLNDVSCTIDTDLANQLETYRAMKKGNIVPDLVFSGDLVSPSTSKAPKRLSDFASDYTLVVYAASWCPKCTEEIPKLNILYNKWKNKGLEVVIIALDTDTLAFTNFVKDSPFMSVCDYKKWESPMVKDYYVFATPTMFLLNKQRELVLRPMSVEQVDAWVDWFLK